MTQPSISAGLQPIPNYQPGPIERTLTPTPTDTTTENPADDINPDWIGKYQHRKPPNTFRILFHNVNGLNGKDAFTDTIPQLLHEQTEMNIDYQGITEHCLNMNFRSTR